MKRKKTFYSELAYFSGIAILAIGTALMARADLGMSMVVVPAYLIHLKMSEFLPWYSFGVSEYIFQAFLLVILSVILHRVKKSYIFSFVTAVLYGVVLDLSIRLVSFIPGSDSMPGRILFFTVGMLACSSSVALFFRTYISPESYELFVKEISDKTGYATDRVKTVYDLCSCFLGIALSFAFFGWWHFEGVKIGTVVCAIVNGWLIGKIGILFDKIFIFRDLLPFREFFQK